MGKNKRDNDKDKDKDKHKEREDSQTTMGLKVKFYFLKTSNPAQIQFLDSKFLLLKQDQSTWFTDTSNTFFRVIIYSVKQEKLIGRVKVKTDSQKIGNLYLIKQVPEQTKFSNFVQIEWQRKCNYHKKKLIDFSFIDKLTAQMQLIEQIDGQKLSDFMDYPEDFRRTNVPIKPMYPMVMPPHFGSYPQFYQPEDPNAGYLNFQKKKKSISYSMSGSQQDSESQSSEDSRDSSPQKRRSNKRDKSQKHRKRGRKQKDKKRDRDRDRDRDDRRSRRSKDERSRDRKSRDRKERRSKERKKDDKKRDKDGRKRSYQRDKDRSKQRSRNRYKKQHSRQKDKDRKRDKDKQRDRRKSKQKNEREYNKDKIKDTKDNKEDYAQKGKKYQQAPKMVSQQKIIQKQPIVALEVQDQKQNNDVERKSSSYSLSSDSGVVSQVESQHKSEDMQNDKLVKKDKKPIQSRFQ